VALLGPLYVLEGSTNGSRVLARVLSRAWGSDGAGLAYLDPYGDGQPTSWKAFKQEVDDLGLDDASQSAVVEAARVTFQAISDISDEVARRDGIGARHGADSAA
jgi:heme oxygenase